MGDSMRSHYATLLAAVGLAILLTGGLIARGGCTAVGRCPFVAPSHCSAGGFYSYGNSALDTRGFVVTES